MIFIGDPRTKDIAGYYYEAYDFGKRHPISK